MSRFYEIKMLHFPSNPSIVQDSNTEGQHPIFRLVDNLFRRLSGALGPLFKGPKFPSLIHRIEILVFGAQCAGSEDYIYLCTVHNKQQSSKIQEKLGRYKKRKEKRLRTGGNTMRNKKGKGKD
jgi:hypothetical protein